MAMDTLDHKIVSLLEIDGRMSITDLADALPLSISATRDRLRKLEASVIDRFTIVINPEAAGRPIEALIDVRLGQGFQTDEIDDEIAAIPAVMDAMHLTGRFDVQLHVATGDVAELDELLSQLKGSIGAEETNTRLILRQLDTFPRLAKPQISS